MTENNGGDVEKSNRQTYNTTNGKQLYIAKGSRACRKNYGQCTNYESEGEACRMTIIYALMDKE
jgi:hypothetical protein